MLAVRYLLVYDRKRAGSFLFRSLADFISRRLTSLGHILPELILCGVDDGVARILIVMRVVNFLVVQTEGIVAMGTDFRRIFLIGSTDVKEKFPRSTI